MNDLPKRKKIRLEGYDYSSCGAYFVTLCVNIREPILWQNVGANCVRPLEKPPLSSIGMIVDNEIQKLNDIYKNVTIDKYCIMPNHIHMIILITLDENGRTQFAPRI